jgi:Mrp family chromosome partitioning ATPase
MRQMLNMLRKEYDYVLLDFPPVGEVSDALSFSKQTDGMLLVARQNYCDRKIFRNVIKQFHYMEAKVLGVVYNCASDGNGLYRKYYYKYRNSKSESSNQTNARQAQKAAKSK